MRATISEELYKVSLKCIEELLKAVDESTPGNAQEMTGLSHFSDVVEAYEKEHFPIEGTEDK